MGNHYTAEQFLKAIPGSGGIISEIARRVGCDWNTAQKYIKRFATVQQAYDDECESILDAAEGQLHLAVQEGEMWAVKYILSTKGKSRGYTEKSESDVNLKTDGLIINIIDEDV